MKHKLSVIIPTRNRLELLLITLNSLSNQSVLPYQIIIVDGSDQPLEKKIKNQINLNFTYLYVNPPSLTKQRNAGIAKVKKGATLVCYLDDDVVVEKNAIKNLLHFWETTDNKTGGTSFFIVNNPDGKANLLYRLFCIKSRKQGKILKSGFVTPAFPKDKNIRTEWLCGGATIWRKEIIENNKYDEWFEGTAYFEDVDFSYRVGKNYDLYVLHNARIQHNPPPFIPKNCVSLGEMLVTYRHYFVKKHFGADIWQFYWSTIGFILLTFAVSIKKQDKINFYQSIGSFIGLIKVIFNKTDGINTNFRKS